MLTQVIRNMLMIGVSFANDLAVGLFTINMLPEGIKLVVKYCSV
jgi:hypothetical protein